MHPRDIKFIMSGSTIELYAPWALLAIMLVAPSLSIILTLSCWSRLALGLAFFLAYTAFSFTEVYKLLLGRLRWPIYVIVCLIILTSLLFIWNSCSTTEVMYSAVIYGKEISGDLEKPDTVWYCVNVRSEVGRDSLCIARDDWTGFNVGDKIMVYYMEGPISSAIVPHRYDDRGPDYVMQHRLG
jgi:hypothetical protein